jgi:2-polyprenyl-3-methyl-5-hydroxy-6-metoxy-1,4-benzoquinol methylase
MGEGSSLAARVRGRALQRYRMRRMRRGALVLDRPDCALEIVGEAVYPSGWAYAPGGISSVEILVNDGPARPAKLGLTRPDVAGALNWPAAIDSGWWAAVSAADLREGENVLRAIARGPSTKPIHRELRFRWRRPRPGETTYAQNQIDLSGERFDPRYPHPNATAIEHRARYALAASVARGRRVLDAGCGFGYGAQTMELAGAKSVDAIDANANVIEDARRIHGGIVRFEVGDVRDLPYNDGAFDLIVCFEVIEHMVEHDVLLDEFRRVLAPDGIIFISSPNRDRYRVENPWHLQELVPEEFEAALRERFANVSLLRQQRHIATLIGDAEIQACVDHDQALPAALLKLEGGPPGSEVFVVAVAGDGPLPSLEPLVALGQSFPASVEL